MVKYKIFNIFVLLMILLSSSIVYADNTSPDESHTYPPYYEAYVVIDEPSTLVQGKLNIIKGRAFWYANHSPVTTETAIISILHFPLSPDNITARTTDPIAFNKVNTDGSFELYFNIVPVMLPEEKELPITAQFNILSIIPDDIPALTGYGWSDTYINMVVISE